MGAGFWLVVIGASANEAGDNANRRLGLGARAPLGLSSRCRSRRRADARRLCGWPTHSLGLAQSCVCRAGLLTRARSHGLSMRSRMRYSSRSRSSPNLKRRGAAAGRGAHSSGGTPHLCRAIRQRPYCGSRTRRGSCISEIARRPADQRLGHHTLRVLRSAVPHRASAGPTRVPRRLVGRPSPSRGCVTLIRARGHSSCFFSVVWPVVGGAAVPPSRSVISTRTSH